MINMVQAMIKISAQANQILNIVKARYSLNDKSEAIELVVNEYGKELLTNLSEEDKVNIEKDVAEVLSIREEGLDTPVVLDLESIRVVKPGKFEIDLVHLFKKDPLIIKLEEGKYMIDPPRAFKKKEE